MSAGTARDLLSKLSSGITKIIAADANAERLESLQKSLSDSRLEIRMFDVNDRAALGALLADCDLCINGVPYLCRISNGHLRSVPGGEAPVC